MSEEKSGEPEMSLKEKIKRITKMNTVQARTELDDLGLDTSGGLSTLRERLIDSITDLEEISNKRPRSEMEDTSVQNGEEWSDPPEKKTNTEDPEVCDLSILLIFSYHIIFGDILFNFTSGFSLSFSKCFFFFYKNL